MKTIEIANATASLSDYARKTRREALVVTRHGKPLAALLPLTKTDWESTSQLELRVSLDRRAFSRLAQGGQINLGQPDATPPRPEAQSQVAASQRLE